MGTGDKIRDNFLTYQHKSMKMCISSYGRKLLNKIPLDAKFQMKNDFGCE